VTTPYNWTVTVAASTADVPLHLDSWNFSGLGYQFLNFQNWSSQLTQLWAFLCSRARNLAGWRPTHTNLLHFSPPCEEYLIMAADPRWGAGRTGHVSSIIPCPLFSGEKYPLVCSLATTVYPTGTLKWVYMSQYLANSPMPYSLWC
jgi:hypothetical protein